MKTLYQERKDGREEKLLKAAKKVAATQGFLAMKVTDVAQAAKVSIGTLYSHFESKEDLILALALESWYGRAFQIERILTDKFLVPTERLIGCLFIDFLFSADHPDFFAVEQLASTPSVLEKASKRRLREMEIPQKEIMGNISRGVRLAVETGGITPWEDRVVQAKMVERGVWCLMVGCSCCWYATRRLGEATTSDVLIPDYVKHNCRALFGGYGWKSENQEDDITRLATYCLLHGRTKSDDQKSGK